MHACASNSIFSRYGDGRHCVVAVMMNVLNFVAHDMFFRILVAISASFILYSVCLYIRNGFVIQYYQNNSKKYNLVWLFVTANQ